MSYDVYSNFKYQRPQPPGIMLRIRRAAWRTYHRSMPTTLMIMAAAIIGLVLFRGVLWYGTTINEGINQVVDLTYHDAGVVPTRTLAERDALHDRRQESADAKARFSTAQL